LLKSENINIFLEEYRIAETARFDPPVPQAPFLYERSRDNYE